MSHELANTIKEPDLIYVSIDTPIEKRQDPTFVGLAWTEEDNSCEHVEYIRKDALIEWTNKMLQDTADRLDFHGNQAFIELYHKLNSM